MITTNKVHPKPHDLPFNEEDMENYGLYIDWLPSKRGNQRLKDFQARQLIFEDDLIDDGVEVETRKNNGRRKFTQRISMSEMDDLTAEELCAYHQFLQDYKSDQINEHKIP